MARLTSAKVIGLSIDVMHGFVFKKVQDCVVDGEMVVQDFVEMRAKH